jgi:hypothetical protein
MLALDRVAASSSATAGATLVLALAVTLPCWWLPPGDSALCRRFELPVTLP